MSFLFGDKKKKQEQAAAKQRVLPQSQYSVAVSRLNKQLNEYDETTGNPDDLERLKMARVEA